MKRSVIRESHPDFIRATKGQQNPVVEVWMEHSVIQERIRKYSQNVAWMEHSVIQERTASGAGLPDSTPFHPGYRLENAGLIRRGREAQWRPCRLEAGPLKDAADWLEEYRRFWEQSFARLDEYLRELQKKEKKHGRKK